MIVVSFFNSLNAFATASTILGTLIGFLTGTYLPVGQLPVAMQYVVKLFPVSYASSMFRQVFMEAPMAKGFASAPGEISAFSEALGVTLRFGDHTVSPAECVLIMCGTAILFFALTVLKLNKRGKA